jgi:hypothetical protein
MISQILTANGTSQQSTSIPTTKVRVVSTAAIYYAVGSNPTAGASYANTSIIGPNTVRYVNMEGLNNKIAILQVAAGGANVSITNVGTVSASGTAL